jgi:transglutaminase-like putative cysteine protease
MKKGIVCLGLLILPFLLTASPLLEKSSTAAKLSAFRDFDFTYTVEVPALAPALGTMRIWIPLPPTDNYQRIYNLKIMTPVSYVIRSESIYPDRSAYLQFYTSQMKRPTKIQVTFEARRYEYKVKLPSNCPPQVAPFPATVGFFLRPDQLVPTNGMIGYLSREETAGVAEPLAKARKIYDYVIATMHYDHQGTGWGRGDAVWACSSHHGNCTDFHSLFIGMARAAGIPARFEIGFPLPLNAHDGKISGYHCWAEFYIEGIGWVPIDAAEASQMPYRQNYFFGAVDQNRILLTRGRDLVLHPTPKKQPLNYFVYPYAELNGKVFDGLHSSFQFKDISVREHDRSSREGPILVRGPSSIRRNISK